MAAVIIGIVKTRLTSSGVMLDHIIIHKGAKKAATKASLLDMH